MFTTTEILNHKHFLSYSFLLKDSPLSYINSNLKQGWIFYNKKKYTVRKVYEVKWLCLSHPEGSIQSYCKKKIYNNDCIQHKNTLP